MRAKHVRNYLDARRSDGLGARSLVHDISILRTFFNFAQREAGMRENPMRRVELPKQGRVLPKAISQVDVGKLLAADATISSRERAMFDLLYGSGLRASELISAKLSDLKLDGRTLMVCGKGDRTRIVPLGMSAVNALLVYLAGGRPALRTGASPFLFLGQ